jgi:hypothetical protein
MALTYLNPIASIGPAAYIVWQNSINSMQLYYKARDDQRNPKDSESVCDDVDDDDDDI